MAIKVLAGDCLKVLNREAFAKQGIRREIALTFFDPPFNQGKKYGYFNDTKSAQEYWSWIGCVCEQIHDMTAEGGALYFMQREKNTEEVLRVLRRTGWTLQNLIIWQKRTSAVPGRYRYGKQYQIIAFATKGSRPRTFNRLRIDPKKRPEHRYERPNGIYVTDCWDDIRELTAGYFAGEEALRQKDGKRRHEQQSPIALLTRIILSSSRPGELVLDPCAGTGTTAIAAKQLGREAVAVEVDPAHAKLIRTRTQKVRKADDISVLREYYRFTPELATIWPA